MTDFVNWPPPPQNNKNTTRLYTFSKRRKLSIVLLWQHRQSLVLLFSKTEAEVNIHNINCKALLHYQLC